MSRSQPSLPAASHGASDRRSSHGNRLRAAVAYGRSPGLAALRHVADGTGTPPAGPEPDAGAAVQSDTRAQVKGHRLGFGNWIQDKFQVSGLVPLFRVQGLGFRIDRHLSLSHTGIQRDSDHDFKLPAE